MKKNPEPLRLMAYTTHPDATNTWIYLRPMWLPPAKITIQVTK